MNKQQIFGLIIVILVIIGTIPSFISKVDESRLKENHCLEEERYYYRITGWFIFTEKTKTTKLNADSYDYLCTKWEEKPSFGASFLGQKLIHEKGTLSEGGRT